MTTTTNEAGSEEQTHGYPFSEIEPKWQKHWDDAKLFEPGDDDDGREKFYALSMFPYPSGALHVGHSRNYALIDAVARFRQQQGYAVINPMGWDAFGLPAENAAIKTGIHPTISTFQHIEKMRGQLKRLGCAFDWSRELYTCREDYYKWTQWLFTKALALKGKSGEPLVYRKTAKVNWCPNDMTVLANEQVVTCQREGKSYDGCFRCETPVEQKELEQWYFRITDYADELLDRLGELEGAWPDPVIAQQREWIGRSTGTNIDFTAQVDGEDRRVTVFTTRADTLFGVTFLAIAPEHPLVDEIASNMERDGNAALAGEIREFVQETMAMDAETRATVEKKGIDTGIKAKHPFTGEEVPVFIGNYVLMYGTGAVMAVPAHDQRDFEFAQKMGLPVKAVISSRTGIHASSSEEEVASQFQSFEAGECAFTFHGVTHDSGEFSGLPTPEAIEKIAQALEDAGKGGPTVNFRLRDWGLSRQRYWGCPIPIIHCEKCGAVPVPEQDLPVKLPDDVEFVPTGRSPLDTHPDFQKVKCPSCGDANARRETDTMDTFVDSSWYYLRYCDPNNSDAIADPAKVKRWLPVDQYIGGREHAILHLIYARFMCKVMRDIGVTEVDEPFTRLFTQGLILKESVRSKSENYKYLSVEDLEAGRKAGKYAEDDLIRKIEKMSKSQYNTVDPAWIADQYGVDTLRAYILFIGPADADAVWEDRAVKGVHNFMVKWWKEQAGWIEAMGGVDAVQALSEPSDGKPSADAKELRRITHLFIEKCEREYGGGYAFNTVIAKAMELVNHLRSLKPDFVSDPHGAYAMKECLSVLACCFAPMAPHIAEELWAGLGNEKTVVETQWPSFREELTKQDVLELPVQVNGKVKATITVSASASKDEVEAIALADDGVKRSIGDAPVRKVIVVPGKIVNIVAK